MRKEVVDSVMGRWMVSTDTCPTNSAGMPVTEVNVHIKEKTMKTIMKKNWISGSLAVFIVVVFLLTGGVGGAIHAFAQAKSGFGFNSPNIAGFPTGAAELTGGGAFVPGTNFAKSGGHFRCTETISQGPLAGCLAGQGIRWDTAALLDSTGFKCSASAAEGLKTATTGSNTVVLVADFYRQGDGNQESFTAKIIVSDSDLAPDVAGVQNVWIQGVGCGSAVVHFN
jgi:hypothetical protein